MFLLQIGRIDGSALIQGHLDTIHNVHQRLTEPALVTPGHGGIPSKRKLNHFRKINRQLLITFPVLSVPVIYGQTAGIFPVLKQIHIQCCTSGQVQQQRLSDIGGHLMQLHKFVQGLQRQTCAIPAAPADSVHFPQFHKAEIRMRQIVKIGIKHHNGIVEYLPAALNHFAQACGGVQYSPQRFLPPIKTVIDTADEIKRMATSHIPPDLDHAALALIAGQVHAVTQQKNQRARFNPWAQRQILCLHQINVIRPKTLLSLFQEFRAEKMQGGFPLTMVDGIQFRRKIVKNQIGIQLHTHTPVLSDSQ